MEEAAQIAPRDIISLIANIEQLNLLASQATPDKPARVALKFDTGMARLGFSKADLPALLAALRGMPAIEPVIAMSHFAVADEISNVSFTEQQIAAFKNLVVTLKDVYPDIKASLANSSGALAFPEARLDIVRAGISLYGNNPFQGTPQEHVGRELKPVMEISARLVQMHPLSKGQSISYGRTFIADRDMMVGIAACGYANGYSRSLSNRGAMLVRGQRAAVVGRVCMQLTALDLSHIPNAAVGDTAYILGGPEPHAIQDWELAAWQNSIPHEVFTSIGALNSVEY
jgi:alanine racemase